MTCQTCNSPHHRATECAATSDRTLMYVTQAEADRLRAENAQLRQDVADLRELRNLDADNCPHCGERDALRARVAELEQRERDTEASAGRMRGYIRAATGKASGEQSGLEAEVLSLCSMVREGMVGLCDRVNELELKLVQADDENRALREQRARQRRELRRLNTKIATLVAANERERQRHRAPFDDAATMGALHTFLGDSTGDERRALVAGWLCGEHFGRTRVPTYAATTSPVTPGTDSSGAGAATSNGAPPVPDMPAQAGEQPGDGDTTSGDTRPPAPAGCPNACPDCGCKSAAKGDR